MGKKIEPLYGLAFEEALKLSADDIDHAINSKQFVLKGLEFSISAELIRKRLIKVSDMLIASTNSDACLTLSQSALLHADIADLLMNEDRNSRYSVIREIATHINSLRLSCENCLNKGCPQRDPSLEK